MIKELVEKNLLPCPFCGVPLKYAYATMKAISVMKTILMIAIAVYLSE